MKLKKWYKKHFDFDRFKWQIIGAGLNIPAFLLAIIAARLNNKDVAYWAWGFLTAIGIIDLYIIRKAKLREEKAVTITRWIRDLLPKKIDNPLMFGFISLVWWLTGPLYALFYMHGFLNDHYNEAR